MATNSDAERAWRQIWRDCPPEYRQALRAQLVSYQRRIYMLKNKYVRWGGLGFLGILILGFIGSLLSPAQQLSQENQLSTAVSALQTNNAPTPTLVSTETPTPAISPNPPSPTPLPTPIIFTGSGDNVIEIDKGVGPAIIHINGNATSRHFAVQNVDNSNQTIDLLVNTTDPYDGYRPLDFRSSDHTASRWRRNRIPLT